MKGESPPSDNVWIGDLPTDLTTEQLEEVFSAYGTVTSARVNTPTQPGRKASALVRFASVEEATWVVHNLNGNYAEGLDTPIVAKFANPQRNGQVTQSWTPPNIAADPAISRQPVVNGSGGGVQVVPKTNVWIGDLPPEFTQEQCHAIFSAYGTVTQCRVTSPSQPGRNASALVRFAMPDEAAWIVENLNGNLPEGLEHPVIVKFANDPRNPGAAAAAAGAPMTTFSQPPPPAHPHPRSSAGWEDTGKSNHRAQPYPVGSGKGAIGAGGIGACGGAGPSGTFQSLYNAIKGAGILGGGHVPNECQLHVKNLPPDTTDADLLRLFTVFGALAPTGAKAMTHPDGSCKGVGFIDFADAACAQAASTALNDFALPDGTILGVTVKRGGGGKGGGKIGV